MEIKVPTVGESIHEALLAKWHRKSGDAVTADDVVCELETEKITLEIHADADGILSTFVTEGETVAIGQVIARVEVEGAPPRKEAAAPPAPGKAERVSPSARKAARERETAPQPKVVPEPEEQREEKPRRAAEERTTRKPVTPIRRAIAQRLLAAARETAALTTFNEADLTALLELRARHREHFQQRHGVKLGLMSFFVKAVVAALKEFPEVNARIDGDDIVYQHFYDIGIAVGAPRGLVVPVLRDADALSFAGIEQTVRDLAEKAQQNRLELSDLEGGTFTITNGGVYGSLLSTPMLNHPQCAVLGMHAVQERPVVRGGEIVVRKMMYLALTYDHRLIDGRTGVEFLKRVKEGVEEPEELLLDL